MARTSWNQICSPCHGRHEYAHHFSQVMLGYGHDHVKVIGHELPGIKTNARPVHGFDQNSFKARIVLVIVENAFPSVSPVVSVIKSSWKLQTRLSRHIPLRGPRRKNIHSGLTLCINVPNSSPFLTFLNFSLMENHLKLSSNRGIGLTRKIKCLKRTH